MKRLSFVIVILAFLALLVNATRSRLPISQSLNEPRMEQVAQQPSATYAIETSEFTEIYLDGTWVIVCESTTDIPTYYWIRTVNVYGSYVKAITAFGSESNLEEFKVYGVMYDETPHILTVPLENGVGLGQYASHSRLIQNYPGGSEQFLIDFTPYIVELREAYPKLKLFWDQHKSLECTADMVTPMP